MKLFKYLSWIIVVLAIILIGCKKSSDSASSDGGINNNNSDVRVTTYTPQDITSTTAKCGGDAIVTQGLTLTAIGICWNTVHDPTADNEHLSSENWNEPFVCKITNLTPKTKYYVRAYALRGLEYYYGDEKSFTTTDSPCGALNGLFSISATEQIRFSQGNLQYQASTNTWRFAENQWDFVGGENDYTSHTGTVPNSSNNLISPTYNGWIDLFGWGTGNNPTNVSTNYSDYYTFNDWGNNSISNGGNIPNTWRTLSNDEWTYIFYSRNTNSGIRYAKARVNGINGIILLPDDWNSEIYNLNEINSDMANYSSNQISTNIWNSRFEANGAVYLPAACLRLWSFVYDIGLRGNYWSSTADFSDDEYSHLLWFDDSNIGASSWICSRTYGQSVRLVYDVE